LLALGHPAPPSALLLAELGLLGHQHQRSPSEQIARGGRETRAAGGRRESS